LAVERRYDFPEFGVIWNMSVQIISVPLNLRFYEAGFGFGIRGGGVIGLLLLIATVWAIANIVQSGVSIGAKALWIVFVLVLPLVGLLAWLVTGPRAR